MLILFVAVGIIAIVLLILRLQHIKIPYNAQKENPSA